MEKFLLKYRWLSGWLVILLGLVVKNYVACLFGVILILYDWWENSHKKE
jgi:hypothetical protein